MEWTMAKAVADHDYVSSGFYVSVNGREEAHLARLESSVFCSGCRNQPAFAYCVDLRSKLATGNYIRNLGNWDPTVQEKAYSDQLPVAAIRAAAGYEAEAAKATDGLKMNIIHWGKDQSGRLFLHGNDWNIGPKIWIVGFGF